MSISVAHAGASAGKLYGMPRAKTSPKKANQFVSLKVSASFRAFVLDQLDGLGDIAPRAMFGGVGLYRQGVFFGIIAGDVLYFKVDAVSRRDFERSGSRPFKPYADRSGSKTYYAVPAEVLESPPELAAWARKAIRAATPARP
jgi:DNA transformation protein